MASRGGFGKGRPSQYKEPMVSENVLMPTDWWHIIENRAEQKQNETGRKHVSNSEVLRDLIAPIVAGGIIAATVQLEGYVWDRETQTVKPFSQKGKAPALQVPFLEAVEGSDYYALAVVGDALKDSDDASAGIPDGHYLIVRKESRIVDGALMHVKWTETSGKNVSGLRRLKLKARGIVEFIPVGKAQKTFTRKNGEFTVKGFVVQAWSGENEEEADA